MSYRLMHPGKADTRYIGTDFSKLDVRALSSAVAEGSLQYSPQGSVLAVDTWKCSRGFVALCTCRGGIPYHHWKLVWDHHGEQQSIGMDLEELSFIPLPSVIIFYCWYSNFCMALLGTECSNYEQRGC